MPREWRNTHSHPKELIIGNPSQDIKTKALFRNALNHFAFISHFEPKIIYKAKHDSNWINLINLKEIMYGT